MPSLPPTPSTPHANKPKLLIVDDDEEIRNQMRWALAQDYEVYLAEDRKSVMEILKRERPAVVTLDLGLPPRPREVEEGFLTLRDILEQDALTKVVVITGRAEKEHALKAIGQGAYDFFCKPIQVDELKVIIRRALYVYQLEEEHLKLQQRLSRESFEEMLGSSPQMKELFTAIRKVATTDAPVLVMGESGTGKELVARAVHRQSARRDGPFITINCGAIPENLLESELFGHEKGAFTGAHIQRKGKIEFAHGGTLFLDEIGEMPLALQVKLLRFVQDYRVERIGGREGIQIDARVIAATNSDLKKAITEGRFREDLYYRLSVVTLSAPPLRERGSDLDLLANAFFQRYAREFKKRLKGFGPGAYEAILAHPWPGNVRELENKIKRAVIMAEGKLITPEDLELPTSSANTQHQTLKTSREEVERERIVKALARCNGNISQVAADLGISRPTLYELMEKLGIER
jgi:two-component system NtrC family response regulator